MPFCRKDREMWAGGEGKQQNDGVRRVLTNELALTWKPGQKWENESSGQQCGKGARPGVDDLKRSEQKSTH